MHGGEWWRGGLDGDVDLMRNWFVSESEVKEVDVMWRDTLSRSLKGRVMRRSKR